MKFKFSDRPILSDHFTRRNPNFIVHLPTHYTTTSLAAILYPGCPIMMVIAAALHFGCPSKPCLRSSIERAVQQRLSPATRNATITRENNAWLSILNSLFCYLLLTFHTDKQGLFNRRVFWLEWFTISPSCNRKCMQESINTYFEFYIVGGT